MDSLRVSLKEKSDVFLVEIRRNRNFERFRRERRALFGENLKSAPRPQNVENALKLFGRIRPIEIGDFEANENLRENLAEIAEIIRCFSPKQRNAFVIDLINKNYFSRFFETLHEMQTQNANPKILREIAGICVTLFAADFRFAAEIDVDQTVEDLLALFDAAPAEAMWALANLLASDQTFLPTFLTRRALERADALIEASNATPAQLESVLSPYVLLVAAVFEAEPMCDCAEQTRYVEAFMRCYVERYESVLAAERELVRIAAVYVGAAEEEEIAWLAHSPLLPRFVECLLLSAERNGELLGMLLGFVTNLSGFASNEFVEAIDADCLLRCLEVGLAAVDPATAVDALLLAGNIALTRLPIARKMLQSDAFARRLLEFLNGRDNNLLINALKCLRNIVCHFQCETAAAFLFAHTELIDLLVQKIDPSASTEIVVKACQCLRGIFEVGDSLALTGNSTENIFVDRLYSDHALVQTLEAGCTHDSVAVQSVVMNLINDFFEVEE